MKNSSAKTLQSSLRSANFILLVLGQGIFLVLQYHAPICHVHVGTGRNRIIHDLRHRAGHIRHSDHTY